MATPVNTNTGEYRTGIDEPLTYTKTWCTSKFRPQRENRIKYWNDHIEKI